MSDFISYPPGSYFLLALLFKIFGVNLLVSRLMENGLSSFQRGHDVFYRKKIDAKAHGLDPCILVDWLSRPLVQGILHIRITSSSCELVSISGKKGAR